MENVLFVWLAEVSADQTVDNFIIPWLKSECGLCPGPGVPWPASVPVSGSDLPASPRSGAATLTAQLILDSGESWEAGQENVKTILNIPLLKMENSNHEEMPWEHFYGDICEGYKYNFVGWMWDAKTLNVLFTLRPESQEWYKNEYCKKWINENSLVFSSLIDWHYLNCW